MKTCLAAMIVLYLAGTVYQEGRLKSLCISRGCSLYADSLDLRGEPDPALKYYRLAVEEKVPFPKAFLILGEHYISQSLWNDSVPLLKKASEFFPGDPEVHYKLGYAMGMVGDFAGAAESLTRVTALDPSNPEAFIMLGLAFLNLGKWREGSEAVAFALKLDPTNERAGKILEEIRKRK